MNVCAHSVLDRILEQKEGTKVEMKGAGEMAQGLRALSALLEDQGSIPSTHTPAQGCKPRVGYAALSSGLHRHQAHK